MGAVWLLVAFDKHRCHEALKVSYGRASGRLRVIDIIFCRVTLCVEIVSFCRIIVFLVT